MLGYFPDDLEKEIKINSKTFIRTENRIYNKKKNCLFIPKNKIYSWILIFSSGILRKTLNSPSSPTALNIIKNFNSI